MTRVLLVTGSRSLAASADAERWARAKIAEALAGCDLLIVGDADGPDAWAWEAVREFTPCAVRYCCAGALAGVAVTRGAPGVATARWTQGHDTHPLKRNAAMVRDAMVSAASGATVTVLALLDGTKPAKPKPGETRATRGTEHTAGLAERAGLTVRREVWPPAPKGDAT